MSETVAQNVVSIERLIPGGRGLGRAPDGLAVFVPGAFPGDRVEGLQVVDKGSFRVFEEHRLLEAGPERRSAPCAVCSECGGCDWMPMPEEVQRRHKLDLLEQALRRTGGIDPASLEAPLEMFQGGEPLAYRSRVRLQIHDGRVGFYGAQSHDLVPFDRCEVASLGVNALIERLKSLVATQPQLFEGLRHIEVRHLDSSAELNPKLASLHLTLLRGKQGPSRAQLKALKQHLSPLAGYSALRFGVESAGYQSIPLPGAKPGSPPVSLQALPGSFTQVNLAINERLILQVLKEASGCSSFLDIYCGSGNFSLPLLAQGLEGTGIELSAEAIEAARAGAAALGVEGRFFAGKSQDLLKGFAGKKPFDLVLVDPPRMGAKEILPMLAPLCGSKLLMISCDPVTLARDLKSLLGYGFHLHTVQGFDMFPQTHHFESFAVLGPPKK